MLDVQQQCMITRKSPTCIGAANTLQLLSCYHATMSGGVLDEMYGGVDGAASSSSDNEDSDSDAEEDLEIDMVEEDTTSRDEVVGGGINHSDFFDDER